MKAYTIIGKNGSRKVCVDGGGNQVDQAPPMSPVFKVLQDLDKPVQVLKVVGNALEVDPTLVAKHKANKIEAKKEHLRSKRGPKLREMDGWVTRIVLGDLDVANKAAIKLYRKSLLDITVKIADETTDEDKVVWPAKPTLS